MEIEPSTSALDLFDELVDLPPSERTRFLTARCGDDAIRREVESLLRAYDDAGGFFAEPGSSDGAARKRGALDALRAPGVGTRIGHYELLELLGEGGFAQVLRARQHHPVRRDVALKLIKPGMDSRQVLARFELERQALAMMDHPGIAAVYDAGVTELGRPYFVMELVRGPRITRYCDENRLGVRQRVRLFVDVCRAVHHAHTKGILHRDLKPSNILVTEVDGRAVPKVIDFGIAKATREKLTDATQLTHERQFLGTPQYMSPEQAVSGGADVDTRSDIYSLGAVLYELLTGASPWDDPTGAPSSQLQQFQRLTSDADAPRASTRVADQARRRELRGEIDWVIGKCLERDRARRYDSAAALADDLEALLQNRPIAAAPPTLSYRATKFARRNSTAVISAVAIVLALLIGSAVSFTQAVRARRAERLAQRRLDEAQAVNDFLTRDMIGAADPAVTLGKPVTVLDALDNAARAVPGKFTNSPLVEAAVRDSVALAYLRLGKPDLALAHAQPALERRAAALGEAHADTIGSMNHVALALAAQGQYPEAEAIYRRALDAARRAHGADHRLTIVTLHQYGDLLSAAGRYAEAEAVCRDAHERARRALGEDDPTTLAAAHNLALALNRAGRAEQAEPIARQNLERSRRARGADDPETLAAVNLLASILGELRRFAEAEPLRREAVEARRRVLGDDHPATLRARHNYAGFLQTLGRLADAELVYEDVLARRRRVQGDDHPETLSTINAYAELLRATGRPAQAQPLHAEALSGFRRTLGDDHRDTIASMTNYAVVLAALRRFDEAEALHREAVQRASRAAGAESPLTLTAMNNHAAMLGPLGRHTEAETMQRKLLDAWRRVRGADHPNAIFTANNLANTLRALGRDDDAAALYADVFQRAPRAAIPPALAATLMASHGTFLVRLGRFDEAEAPLREARRRLTETNQSRHPKMRDVLAGLATVCERAGRTGEAAALRAELAQLASPATSPAIDATTQPASRP